MMNDHVIAVSHAVARFHRRWNLVRRGKLTVVHNFIDGGEVEDTADRRTHARAEIGVGESTVVIGKIGNLFREKGVHDLIDAMALVLLREPKAHLLLQGRAPGDYRAALARQIERHGMAPHVTWLPEVEPALVKRTLAALDIIAVPSLDEPLSTVCLEAMTAGLPVVATRVGGMRELVVDGETGLLVPPASPATLAQSLGRLVRDRDLRATLGGKARARARQLFSPEAKLAAIERVFADVVARRTPAAIAPVTSAGPVFDAKRAEYRCIALPCRRVIDLLPLSHAPDRVAGYREQMREGAQFPPISVIRLLKWYVIADGHKRFSAFRQLGHDGIVVEVWPLRRWLLDQWRQVCGNARKNARIVATSFSDPAAAWRLLLTTLLHWRRVATSLAARAAGRLP
jgi:hypothetical protein